MKDRYEDILLLPHHVSATRPQMSAMDRAAQFSAFAALTGFGSEIQEVERQTQEPVLLTESAQQELDEKLRYLAPLLKQIPQVKITFFQEDTRKDGGSYITVTGGLTKIDPVGKYLYLSDGRCIDMEKLLQLESPLLPADAESDHNGA